jgi:long-chain fatty acid transport protein
VKNSNGWLRLGALGAGIALLATAPAALAAGFAIFEPGAKATGMAGASIASADDGSSMFYNPAGLASNDKFIASVGVTLIKPTTSFEGDSPYPGKGYSADMKSQTFFPPNLFVAAPIAKNVNLAFGTWFPNGLSTAWQNPDTFAGRFLSQRIDLRQYAVGLQVSAQLTDWLSIGAGPELRVSDVKLQRNAAVFSPYSNSFVDAAHVDIQSQGFATNLTWAAGIQIKPFCNFTLGISYHGAVNQKYTGNATFYQISTGHADLDAAVAKQIPMNTNVPAQTTVQYPALTAFGAAYKFTDNLTVEVAATYTQWSVFDATVLSFSAVNGIQAPTATLAHNWKDVWSYRIGMNYQATPKFGFQLGALYDQTPQPNTDLGPLLPDANRTGVSFGLGYKIGKASSIEFGNLFLFFHDRSTSGQNQDGYNGTYKTFADLAVLNFKTSF